MKPAKFVACVWAVFAAVALSLYMGYRTGYRASAKATDALLTEKTAEINDMAQRLDAANFRLDQYINRLSWSAIASWYGDKEHGRQTASGRVFDMDERIIAHKELPFGTVLLVERLDNGKFSIGQVLDDGPNVKGKGRSLDLSWRMAEELEMLEDGLAVVRVTVLSWPGRLTR